LSKTAGNIDKDLREAAQNKMKAELKGKPFRRGYYNYLVRKTRDHVSSRENLRFERTRGFGLVRRMFSALGIKLFEQGHLQNPRDVFYLKLDEIKDLLTSAFSDELKDKIVERQLVFDGYRKQKLPQERFFTHGYDFSDQYIYSEEKLEISEGDLQGIGCCPGRVQGRVRLIHDPSEINSLEGDILVTSSTDPGWVTLFPTCSAIIVERGSLLSHSAIVSREMGIPCIVGVKGLLSRLENGQEVIMDGSAGTIKVL